MGRVKSPDGPRTQKSAFITAPPFDSQGDAGDRCKCRLLVGRHGLLVKLDRHDSDDIDPGWFVTEAVGERCIGVFSAEEDVHGLNRHPQSLGDALRGRCSSVVPQEDDLAVLVQNDRR
jgi:hypothetical protein